MSRTAALTSLIIPLIVAGVPIIDTFSAIVRRKRAHISIGQADKGHIHHRLIQEGYNQKQAVLLIYAWCIMLSAGAAAINQVEVPMRVLIFTVLAIGSAAFAKHLHLFEPVLRHHYNKRTHEDELVTPTTPPLSRRSRQPRSAKKSATTSSRASCRECAKAPLAKRGRAAPIAHAAPRASSPALAYLRTASLINTLSS